MHKDKINTNQDLKKEINTIQDLYSKILNTKIDLPKIVVVGPQSSGKSSVLEQLLQLDFLPRGVNMVTRCPIVINIRESEEEFIQFEQKKYTFTNSSKENLLSQIEKKVNEICGIDKVSKTPLVLYVYKRNILQTTLIDLPGLTKIPVGNQPKDIEKQIEEIVLEYSKGPSTIILAIVNANVDIGNSEALKMAKRVDSGLERTLGVVTKIDLMDEGTNCVDLLNNKHSPLRLGYVGVVNRSFIESNASLEEAREKERGFFSLPPYNQFEGRIGSSYLMHKVHNLFSEEVKKSIPQLHKTINKLLEDRRRSIDLMNINSILIDYYNCLLSLISTHKHHKLFSTNMNILYEFKTCFDRLVCEYDFSDVERDIKSSDSLVFHEEIIKDVVRKNTEVIEKKVLERIDLFSKHLYRSITSINSNRIDSNINRDINSRDIPDFTINTTLNLLSSSLNSISVSQAEKQYDLLVEDIKKYIKIQGLYINTRYPSYDINTILTNNNNSIIDFNNKKYFNGDINLFSKISFSIKNKAEVERDTIIKLASEYLNIIKMNTVDHSLKCMNYYFLYYFRNEFLTKLIGKLEKGKLGREIENLKKQNEEIKKEIKKLEECKKIFDREVYE